MFFKDRINSIKTSDYVLEIGPGATPHFRSDIFLELQYSTDYERIAQSGYVGVLETKKPVVYYDGGRFPFNDNEFDYVICSHVLEHVDDANLFLEEISRVGKRGYLEFPTIYYDYIYNFPEHKLFLFYKDNIVKWMTKSESGLNNYQIVQSFFYKTTVIGYKSFINDLKSHFFQGFEWSDSIKSERVSNLQEVCYSNEEIDAIRSTLNHESLNIPEVYSKISIKNLLKFKIKKTIFNNVKKILQ